MPGLCKVYEAESDPLSERAARSLGEQGMCRDQGTESGGVEMQQVPSAVGNSQPTKQGKVCLVWGKWWDNWE